MENFDDIDRFLNIETTDELRLFYNETDNEVVKRAIKCLLEEADDIAVMKLIYEREYFVDYRTFCHDIEIGVMLEYAKNLTEQGLSPKQAAEEMGISISDAQIVRRRGFPDDFSEAAKKVFSHEHFDVLIKNSGEKFRLTQMDKDIEIKREAIETAKNFLKMGATPEQVSKGTKLPIETVRQLSANN
jgi:hypothetical protein